MNQRQILSTFGYSFCSRLLVVLATISAGATPPKSSSASAAKTAFNAHCAMCHGRDGTGSALGRSLGVADLRSRAVQKQSDAQVVAAVSSGKNNMPAFKEKLTSEQIAQLIRYVRQLGKKK